MYLDYFDKNNTCLNEYVVNEQLISAFVVSSTKIVQTLEISSILSLNMFISMAAIQCTVLFSRI